MRFNASKTLLRIEIRLIRIFNTNGPRMDPNDGRVLSNFTVQTLQGTDITIYGEGSQTRSFCFVDDLVRGIVAFCEQSKSIGPINLGNAKELTVKELADLVLTKIGGKSKIVFKPLIKRFDRRSSGERMLLEDFAQIFKYMESDKEEGSMEEIASAIDKYSSSPVIEKSDYFRRILFSFVFANGDMHLKNWSMIYDPSSKLYKLSPVYDWLNVRASMPTEKVEMILPIGGKRADLDRSDLEKFGLGTLKLNKAFVQKMFLEVPVWMSSAKSLYGVSALSETIKVRYLKIVEERSQRLLEPARCCERVNIFPLK